MSHLDIIKKRKTSPTTASSAKVGASSTHKDVLRKHSKVNNDYINSYIADVNSFFEGIEDEYSGIGYANASDVYGQRSSAWESLKARENAIRDYLEYNKGSFTPEDYSGLLGQLDSISESGATAIDAFKGASDFYGQWATEDEYNGERTWFQESSGNTGETVAGSTADWFENIWTGIVGLGEKGLDALATLGPYMAKGYYYQHGGGYNQEFDKLFNDSIEADKADIGDFVAKDLYDESELVKKIFSEPLKEWTGIDTSKHSVFGAKSDSLIQSAGQLGGTAALQAVGIPAWVTMGLTTMGSESENALNSGATLNEAAFSGLVSAGAEILTEKISGGINLIGGKTFNEAVLDPVIDRISNRVLRKLISIGVDVVGEGGEEILSGVLSAIGQKLSYASESEWNELLTSDDALESFIGGAVLGLVGSGSSSIARSFAATEQYSTPDSVKSLVDNAMKFGEGTEARGLAEKYNERLKAGKRLSGTQIANIHEASENQYLADDKAKLKKSILKMLGEYGEKTDVTPIADALVKYAQGYELTSAEVKLINNSTAGNRVMTELNPDNIKSGNLANNWAKDIGTNRINPQVYNATGTNTKLEKIAATSRMTESEGRAKSISASKSGKTTYVGKDGKETEVNVDSIVSTKGGLKVKLDNGETVSVSDLSFGTVEESLAYEMVARMEAPLETANEIIKTFKPTNASQATLYFSAVPLAYEYGKIGYKEGLKNVPLTEQQKLFAYNRGRLDAKSSAEAKTKAVTEAGAKKAENEKSSAPKSGIIFEEGASYDEATANKLQKSSMAVIELIDKVSNVEVHVFASYLDKNGKRVAKVNGKIVKAPNGYFKDGNKVYIDLNAGSAGEGAMLYVMGHEATHYIRKWNAEGFKEIGDFLIAEFGKQGVPVTALIEAQKNKIINRYTAEKKSLPSETKLADMAYEELVADAMSEMFADPRAIEKLLKLKQKSFDLWSTLGKAIKAVLDKIKSAIGVYKSKGAGVAQEAMFVRDFSVEAYNRLQNLYIKAFVQADANYEAVQNQLATDAIRGDADGAVAKSEVTEALIETDADDGIVLSTRTEYEALPKQMMNLTDGSGTILYVIEGLESTPVKGISSRTIKGYTGRDVRGYAMNINGFTKAEIKRVNEFMDTMADFMEEAGVTYKFIGLDDVKNAKLHFTYDSEGEIESVVLSAMVKNGDYPVNFDLSSICKKRVAMSALIDKLAKRGTIDSGTVSLTPRNIFKINTALKDAGYETACLGCFVESKHYNSLKWAESFCAKWNAAVKKVNPNATYFGYGDASYSEESFTLEDAIKIDEAANKYIATAKTERLANAIEKYKVKEQNGQPLVEGNLLKVDGEELYTFSKAARNRLEKSETISDALKEKYLTCDVSTLNMADVEFLLENGILPGASLSNKQTVTELVKSGEPYQHLLKPSDLLTDRGISKLEALPNFHGALYGHYGSGTPKLMQSFTPYNSEIALLPTKKGEQTLAEYLYSIAGVRMQSFSDFQIQNIYDYLQMVADLAARKVPAHAYTKEISFAKLLGMTGIKVNLSVMFDIDPTVDKAHAGLTHYNPLIHKGEYAKIILEDSQGKWVYNVGDYKTQQLFIEAFPNEAKRFLQSIGFADAVKLQTTEGYSANCGIIGVGYSDLGILAMLDDNRIRYVIPYHASSLPADIKVATHIELGADYTSTQNNMKITGIVDHNGNKVNWSIKEAYKRLGSGQAVINELNENVRKKGWVIETKKAQNGHGSYGMYEDLQKTSDPRKTAENFIDWCIGNNTLPLFYQFASHNNYYKLLYDFNVYDCITEQYAPQGAVTNTYPTMVDGELQSGDVTKGDFDAAYLKGTIDKQMAFMNEYNRNLDTDLEKLADNMEKGNYSLDEQGIVDGELVLSDRDSDYEDYSNPITIEDVEILRTIGRKSISKFSSEDMKKAKKWAHKYNKDLGVKSPFFRAWFGEWRAHDQSKITVVKIPNVAAESQRSKEGIINRDTERDGHAWKIRLSGHGERNTRAHAGIEKKSVAGLTNIKELVENAILLDTEVHAHHDNNAVNDYIAFDHKFYALGENESGNVSLYRITVEELFQSKTDTNDLRFHNLKYISQIEKVADDVSGSSNSNKNQPYTARDSSTTEYIVADLYKFVKTYDKEFKPNAAVSPLLLNEDGTPKVFYHGTPNGKFNVFDYENVGKVGGSQHGYGFYFTDNEREAGYYTQGKGTVIKAYIKIDSPIFATKKDLSSNIEKIFERLPMYAKTNLVEEYGSLEEAKNALSKYDNGTMLSILGSDTGMHPEVFNRILLNLGYDGIIYSEDGYASEYVVFKSNQIKSATDNIGTFNEAEENINYSDRTEDTVSNRTLLANALESVSTKDERDLITSYRARITDIDKLQKKLEANRAEAKTLRFKKGITAEERSKLASLDAEANRLERSITKHDKKLLELEATDALQKVLEREKKNLRKKLMQKNKEALEKRKERSNESELRTKIKALKQKFINMLNRPTENQYVPKALAEAIVKVCQIVDTSTPLYKKDGSLNKAQAKRNAVLVELDNLIRAYERTKTDPDDLVASAYVEDVAEYLKEIKDNFAGKNVSNLSLAELDELYNTMRAIDDILVDARKLIGMDDLEYIYDAGDSVIKEQQSIKGKRKNGKMNKIQSLDNKLALNSLSPMRAVLRMAGYDEDSVLYELFRAIEQGVWDKEMFVMEAVKMFEELTTGKNEKLYEEAIYKPFGKALKDKNGKEFRVTKMQMMQAVMSYERELANNKLSHVTEGGFTFADYNLLAKGKLAQSVAASNSHTVTMGAVIANQFKSELAKDSWAQEYMKAARKFFNETARDAINDVTLKLQHRIIANETAYIPYEVNKNFVPREIQQDEIQQTISGYGMLKDIQTSAKQPLVITGLNNVLDRHINQVGNVHGLAIPIRDFNKVWGVKLGNTSVVDIIQENWGLDGTKLITQAIKDVQGSRLNNHSELYQMLKGGYISATFMLNGSVVMKQIGSAFTSSAKLKLRNPATVMANLVYTMAHFKEIAAEVDKYTPAVWMRRQGMTDGEMHTLMTEAKKPGLVRMFNKLPAGINPAKWITAMDASVALSLWKFAKEDVKSETGLDGEELLKATAVRFNDVVANTQSMSDVLHRPEIQKSGNILSEVFGTFKTDLYQFAGQLRVALGKYMANKTEANRNELFRTVYGGTMNTIWSNVIIATLFALIRYKVDRYRDDEDEELTFMSWLTRIGTDLGAEIVAYIFPMAGGETVGAILDAVIHNEVKRDFADSMVLSAISEFVNNVTKLASDIADGGDFNEKNALNILKQLLGFLGIPANNIERIIKAIKYHAEDITNGEFFSFEAGKK